MNRRQDPRAQNSFAPGNRHRSCLRVFQRPAPAPALVQFLEAAPQGIAGRVLLGGNHGAAHGKAGLINIILAGFVGVDFQRLEIALGENFQSEAVWLLQRYHMAAPAHAVRHAPVNQGFLPEASPYPSWLIHSRALSRPSTYILPFLLAASGARKAIVAGRSFWEVPQLPRPRQA